MIPFGFAVFVVAVFVGVVVFRWLEGVRSRG